MGQLTNILNGWKNFIVKSEVTEKLAEQRAEFCVKCPFAVEKYLLTFIEDRITEVQGFECTRCGCPISAKIRSTNEKCPEELW